MLLCIKNNYACKKSSIIEFIEKFGTKDKCLSYFKEQKLKEVFCCIKCKRTNQKKGYLKFVDIANIMKVQPPLLCFILGK